MSEIALISGLAPLAEDYDVFIIDLWGVLHDGMSAFPEAVACLEALKARKKTVIILSNAPRRAESVAERNSELGIPAALCDLVMSSGEETWRHLRDRPTPWYQALGRRCFHLGPERDIVIREGLAYDFVDNVEESDFILLTGALRTEDSLATYQAFLSSLQARRLPMVCANPDLEVIRGGRREICAGTIARGYEALGGEVTYHGKPDPRIYANCLQQIEKSDPEGVLVIGDSLRTDLAGAARSGMDSLFIAEGIHADEMGLGAGAPLGERQLRALFDGSEVRPRAAMARLRW